MSFSHWSVGTTVHHFQLSHLMSTRLPSAECHSQRLRITRLRVTTAMTSSSATSSCTTSPLPTTLVCSQGRLDAAPPVSLTYSEACTLHIKACANTMLHNIMSDTKLSVIFVQLNSVSFVSPLVFCVHNVCSLVYLWFRFQCTTTSL